MARTVRSAEDRAAARLRILRAANDVFAAGGFRGASLDDVAREAGVTRSALLYHFGSKDALLLALLQARDDELGLTARPTPLRVPSPANLFDGFSVGIRSVLESRELVRLAHALTAEAADPDHPAHEWLVDRSKRLRDDMTAAFEEAEARGDIALNGIRAGDLSAVLLGAIEGLEAQWLADPDEVDVLRSLSALQSIVLSGLAPLS